MTVLLSNNIFMEWQFSVTSGRWRTYLYFDHMLFLFIQKWFPSFILFPKEGSWGCGLKAQKHIFGSRPHLLTNVICCNFLNNVLARDISLVTLHTSDERSIENSFWKFYLSENDLHSSFWLGVKKIWPEPRDELAQLLSSDTVLESSELCAEMVWEWGWMVSGFGGRGV